jgi:alkylmercury lyase
MTTTRLDDLATRFSTALRSTAEDAQLWELFRPVLALLARGEPVSIAEIAAAAGWSPEDVQTALERLPSVEWDAQGRVAGLGLSLRPTPHRFEVDGQALFTWCALDALLFPALLGKPARIVSPCRATGEPVRLTVTPGGVETIDPSSAVVSIVEACDLASVRSVVCDNVHFFYAPAAASRWLDAHPGATIASVEDGFRLGQMIASEMFK